MHRVPFFSVPREDRRSFDEARPILLAAAGGEPFEVAPLQVDVAPDRVAAASGMISELPGGAGFQRQEGEGRKAVRAIRRRSAKQKLEDPPEKESSVCPVAMEVS